MANPRGELITFEGVSPKTKSLSVRVTGKQIEWDGRFRREMRALCRRRGALDTIPVQLMAAIIRSHSIVLLWPGLGNEPNGCPVHATAKGRRIRTELAAAFEGLHVELPDGVAIAVPVTRCESEAYGHCLALHFSQAQFLPERSRSTAVSLLAETPLRTHTLS